MRKLFLTFTCISLLSCGSEKKGEKELNLKTQPQSVNEQLSSNKENSINNNQIKRKQLFRLFLKKFENVSLPYEYKLTSNMESKAFLEKDRLNKNTFDTLFAKAEFFNESFRYGMLSDTSNFYSLIFFFPADDFYPVLTTYTKSGDLISQAPLTVNGCGSDCGLTYCSQTVVIDKNLLIKSADSTRYDFHCDDEGNLMKDSGLLIVVSKTGQVSKNGKVNMGREIRLEKKLPTTLPNTN